MQEEKKEAFLSICIGMQNRNISTQKEILKNDGRESIVAESHAQHVQYGESTMLSAHTLAVYQTNGGHTSLSNASSKGGRFRMEFNSVPAPIKTMETTKGSVQVGTDARAFWFLPEVRWTGGYRSIRLVLLLDVCYQNP